jgi:hypothetical protein
MPMPRLYRFPAGRCLYSLRQVAQRATARDMADLARLAALGVEEAQRVLRMVLLAQQSHAGQYPPEAAQADSMVDHGVAALDSYIDSQARMYQGEERGAAAERLSEHLLPNGVAAITRLPYAEQHGQVDALLDRAAEPELADDVAQLPDLTNMLAKLREHNTKYGAILDQRAVKLDREATRAAENRCQDILNATVGMIYGHYALHAPDRLSERDHLLEPILHQNAAIRAARRQRQPARDIDPDTGADLPAPAPGNGDDDTTPGA